MKGLFAGHACGTCAAPCNADHAACPCATCGHAEYRGGCAACGAATSGCASCGAATNSCAACGHEACGCEHRACCRSCESHCFLDMLEGLFSGAGCCGHRAASSTCVASCGNSNGGCSTCGSELSGNNVYSTDVAPAVPPRVQPQPAQPASPAPPRPLTLPKAPPLPPAPRGDPSAFMMPGQTIYSTDRGVARD
jgi:hypothetical protein